MANAPPAKGSPPATDAPPAPDAADAPGGALQDRLKGHLRRLDIAAAEAARDYDQARQAMSQDHAAATERGAGAAGRQQALAPGADAVMAGQRPLSAAAAKDLLAYLKAAAEAGDAGQAQRLSWGATQPPGKHPPGQEFS